jgi:hypothetical protein
VRAAPAAHALTLALAVLAGLIAAMAPPAARAASEEFSTFSVEREEEDDESALDHLLTRTPREWRQAWETAPLAFRTSEGCLTSGQWFEVDDLKLQTELGARARFAVQLARVHDNSISYDDLALQFRFPIRAGLVSVDFHPSYDKSRQDFALAWETGADSARFHLLARFMIEDMLNNLWAWRQTRVGNQSEPYLRHPYVPEVQMAWHGTPWRAEAGARYLTPSEKQVLGYNSFSPPRIQTLWGTFAWTALEWDEGATHVEVRGSDRQALGTDQELDLPPADHHDFRREWSGEAMIGRRLGGRLRALARWIYQSRTEIYGPPVGPGRFEGLDRIAQLELARDLAPGWALRAGALYDRIGFAHEGSTLYASEQRDKESRAYIGLMARFGRVSVEGIEGIELDREPYQVVFHHDKGFLKLQASF